MTNPSKAKGSQWERRLLKYFRNQNYDAELLRTTGVEDEGDLDVKIGGVPFVFEAKAEKKIDLARYVREAEAEASHYASHRNLQLPPSFAAIVKRRNHVVDEAYVVLPLKEYMRQVAPPF